MKNSTIVTIIVVILVLFGIYWFAWGPGVSSGNQASQATTTDTSLSGPTVVLSLGTSNTIGNYLTSSNNGMTLYTYKNDSPGTSTCTGTCASTWIPYTVSSPTNLGAQTGISGTVATITRSDGSYQVTYNGMPLYFYGQDANVGDMNGNNVAGLWSVAMP